MTKKQLTCRFWLKLNKTGRITSKMSIQTYTVNCPSSNLIDSMECKICGIQYVEETLIKIKNLLQHHFNKNDYSGIKDVTIFMCYSLFSSTSFCQGQEFTPQNWIHRLKILIALAWQSVNPNPTAELILSTW